jgi:hypothetical protein
MNRRTAPVLLFTVVYLLGATAAAIALGSSEFLLYLGVSPLLIAAVALIHRKIDLPLSLLWALSLLGFVHVLGGLIVLPPGYPTAGKPYLYNLWLIPGRLKFDQVVHTYGNAIATWLCWHLLRYSIALVVKRKIQDIPARPAFLLVCFLAGIGVGALNELLEFGATQTVPGDTNVGGYVNTGWDLVSNTLGGLITVLVIWIKRRGKPLPKPSQ